MRIGIFSEFPYCFSQFYSWFNKYAGDLGVYFKFFEIPNYTIPSKDLDGISDVDFAFVYASYFCNPNGAKSKWNWWELPLLVKEILRGDAKVAAMWDFEGFMETGKSEPKGFANVLNNVDVCCTVFPDENPMWKRLTSTPVVYLPLPHAWSEKYGIPTKERDNQFVIFKHSPPSSSANHIFENIVPHIDNSLLYVPTYFIADPIYLSKFLKDFSIKNQCQVFTSQNNSSLMNTIQHSRCAIDDNTGYYGWSRFVYECAMSKLPCITSNHSQSGSLFFPELVTKHGDYKRQIELIEMLSYNDEIHEAIAELGWKRAKWYFSPPIIARYLTRMIGVAYGKIPFNIKAPIRNIKVPTKIKCLGDYVNWCQWVKWC